MTATLDADPLEEVTLDGGVLLDRIKAKILEYCVLPSSHAAVAVVLWVALTHVLDAFEYAPRLVIRSAEKRSGKSRLMEVIDPLVKNPLRAVNATTAYIFRSISTGPTILFDEADTIFGSKKQAENNEDLRGLLNAGFQRGLPVGRTVGPNHIPTEFETFAMAALAGIGKMPDTIEDRAVVVIMRRRKQTETVQPYRTRRDKPHFTLLADQLALWADQISAGLQGYEPTDLRVEDRAADVWEPLIAVADMAGGAWPELARRAAAAMTSAHDEDEADSLNLQLLTDIRDIWNESSGLSFMTSKAMCAALDNIDDAPWRAFEMNPWKLGKKLSGYGIKTGYQDGYKRQRGYLKADFSDAFERYLPTTSPETAETVRNYA